LFGAFLIRKDKLDQDDVAPAKANTVHLVFPNADGDLVDAERAPTPRPQGELAHLPFDTARRAASATRHDAITKVGQLVEQRLMKAGDRLRGE
jgi:hypothetical protein